MKMLLLILTLATVNAQFLLDPYRFVPVYTPNNTVFDGTNDWLSRTGNLTALSDSKTFTFACWVRFDGDGQQNAILQYEYGGVVIFNIIRNTSNQIQMQGRDGINAVRLNATTSQTITAASGWTHLYICIDLANSGNRHIYFDGAEDASVTWTTYANVAINFVRDASSQWSIGANFAGNNSRFGGPMAELWFNDVYFNDPTKFFSGGNPVDLGADGSTPTGSAPVLYLSSNGGGNAWATDTSGNGNTFTVNGTLSTTTGPP